jgi:hypothetical protein
VVSYFCLTRVSFNVLLGGDGVFHCECEINEL